MITEVHCFGAVPAKTAVTDHKVQQGFGQFLHPGNPEITEQPGSSRESGFVLLVDDWDPHKRKRVDALNEWLCEWCHAQGFGYYGFGCSFEKGGMLTADGSRLTRRATDILGNKLSGLVSRALN